MSVFFCREGVGERTGIESGSEKVAFLWRMKAKRGGDNWKKWCS
jgi:hypothetical protein